jgi:hypothetical protein
MKTLPSLRLECRVFRLKFQNDRLAHVTSRCVTVISADCRYVIGAVGTYISVPLQKLPVFLSKYRTMKSCRVVRLQVLFPPSPHSLSRP